MKEFGADKDTGVFSYHENNGEKTDKKKVTAPNIPRELLDRLNASNQTVREAEYNSPETKHVDHDYDGAYYLENNPNKKTGINIKIDAVNKGMVDDTPTSALGNHLVDQAILDDPALGTELSSKTTQRTFGKMIPPEPQIAADQPEPQVTVELPNFSLMDDDDGPSPQEVRQKITLQVRSFFEKAENGQITATDIAELYDEISTNFEKPLLKKDDLNSVQKIIDFSISKNSLDDLTNAKALYMAYDFGKTINAREDSYLTQSHKDQLREVIKNGDKILINIISEAVSLPIMFNPFAKDIFFNILSDIQPPLQNLDVQIKFGELGINETSSRIAYFEENRHFIKSMKAAYKNLNDINFYTRVIFQTAEAKNGLSQKEKDELEHMMKKNIELYSSRLNQISDDSLDHDHILPLFKNMMSAKKMGIPFELDSALAVFSTVYNKIYTNNGPRLAQHIVDLAQFCDDFGQDSLRNDILTRGLQSVREDDTLAILKEKYGV